MDISRTREGGARYRGSNGGLRNLTPVLSNKMCKQMHRIRSGLVSHRTAKANQIRGLMAEYGIVAPVGINQLRQAIPCWLEDAENSLSEVMRELLHIEV